MLPAFGQGRADPQAPQNSGITKIDQYIEYVRNTCDANSTVYQLAAAQADLKASLDLSCRKGIVPASR
jgi:hypothetical protein